MEKFMSIFVGLFTQSMNQIYEFITKYGPGILYAVVVIFVGWILALLVKKIVSKLLKALGFNILSQKTGFAEFLRRGNIQKTPSQLIGTILYWVVFLNALIAAQDAVDLQINVRFMQFIILYIPKMIMLVVFIALALFISKFVANLISKTAKIANLPFSGLIAAVSRYTIIGFALIMMIQYLNIPHDIQLILLVVFFIVIPFIMILFIAISGRTILTNILNGIVLAKDYKPGQKIGFEGETGIIEKIGMTTTSIVQNDSVLIIPNSVLSNTIVKITKNDEKVVKDISKG